MTTQAWIQAIYNDSTQYGKMIPRSQASLVLVLGNMSMFRVARWRESLEMSKVLLEGFTIDEILELPNDHLEGLLLQDEALVFKVGSASILGKFKVLDNALYLELAHIDGGGEGALPSLASLAKRYARREGLEFIEWRVHAVHCGSPNLKLRRVLERKGFVIQTIEDLGECYWRRISVDSEA